MRLQILDERSLDTISGGMISRFPWTTLFRSKPLDQNGDSYLMPGGIRDQQQAAARERYEALVRANPGILAPPDPNYSVQLFQHRLASGYGKPHVVRP